MDKILSNWKTSGLGIALLLVAAFKTIQTGALDTTDVYAGLAALGLVAASDAGK
jgi:hypothetical protein